ncbi:MAG: acetamidase/formamidase family protein, partial [Anaerolineae bacterium]|nr:acetamidase/formamidase family protein [Anaerolineae bacterium]
MRRIPRHLRVPVDRRYRVLDPVCTIDPGETVVVETVNHMTPVVRSEEDLHPHGSPGYREREETGPIYVRGVRPGDTLAIRIEGIEIVGLPHAHG